MDPADRITELEALMRDRGEPLHPTGDDAREWLEIGKRCSAGRRSVWLRVVYTEEAKENEYACTTPETVERIDLRAGREGDDFAMSIDHTNPQFRELLDLFCAAAFAATT